MVGGFEAARGSAHDLAGWQALITRIPPPVLRVEPEPVGAPFAGRISWHNFDQILALLIDVRAGHHTVGRAAKHVSATPNPHYVIKYQLAGRSVFCQAGARAALEPGDYSISTTSSPYTWEFDGDFTVFSLRFPQSLIDAPPTSLRPLVGRTLSLRDGFGRHLGSLVRSIAADLDLLRGSVGSRIAHNLVDLFTTALTERLAREADTGRGPTSLFAQVADYIGENLGDPELDSGMIAAANYVSTRYLQVLFQARGTTVTTWIRERRLANCRRDLADPLQRDRCIGEVAARWGFVDQSYFSRLFRQAFGESPRQWRSRALAPSATWPGPSNGVR